ncbi:hypothetical protein SISNIDRAFT_470319 [Sistotremastrum niveocremeum HHB9708]|uniref:Uncharacterized protein n=1 Tax=Sistotremastrum niveocremeum HHB9708 TaxID=1314777 RepID=A0A164P3P1_9AGAM|nr:hypothetical protein SISNIDRAFT_470319 [Sistotremastrum niveocremeum HHB9708]
MADMLYRLVIPAYMRDVATPAGERNTQTAETILDILSDFGYSTRRRKTLRCEFKIAGGERRRYSELNFESHYRFCCCIKSTAKAMGGWVDRSDPDLRGLNRVQEGTSVRQRLNEEDIFVSHSQRTLQGIDRTFDGQTDDLEGSADLDQELRDSTSGLQNHFRVSLMRWLDHRES